MFIYTIDYGQNMSGQGIFVITTLTGIESYSDLVDAWQKTFYVTTGLLQSIRIWIKKICRLSTTFDIDSKKM